MADEEPSKRFLFRLLPDDQKSIETVQDLTSTKSKSEVVRRAIDFYRQIWDLKHSKFELSFVDRNNRSHRELPDFGGLRADVKDRHITEARTEAATLEVRFTLSEYDILNELVKQGAATTRSKVVRQALIRYARVVSVCHDGWALIARSSASVDEYITVNIPGLRESPQRNSRAPVSNKSLTDVLTVDAASTSALPKVLKDAIDRWRMAYDLDANQWRQMKGFFLFHTGWSDSSITRGLDWLVWIEDTLKRASFGDVLKPGDTNKTSEARSFQNLIYASPYARYPSIITMPFFLSRSRWPGWTVIPYGTQTLMGVIIHEKHSSWEGWLQTRHSASIGRTDDFVYEVPSAVEPAHKEVFADLSITDNVSRKLFGEMLVQSLNNSSSVIYTFSGYVFSEVLEEFTYNYEPDLVDPLLRKLSFLLLGRNNQGLQLPAVSPHILNKTIGADSGDCRFDMLVFDPGDLLALLPHLPQGYHALLVRHGCDIPVGLGVSLGALPKVLAQDEKVGKCWLFLGNSLLQHFYGSKGIREFDGDKGLFENQERREQFRQLGIDLYRPDWYRQFEP